MNLKIKFSPNLSLIAGAILTLVVGIVAIAHATSNVFVLINIAALIIVFGGVAASAIVMFPFHELKDITLKIFRYFRHSQDSPAEMASELVRAATTYARSKNFSGIGEIKNKRVFDALELIQSGLKREDIATILKTRREATANQSIGEAGLLLTLAKLAPGYGLVGTLIGLIVLLFDLGSGSFDKVGPAMAIALTATLYGVVLANMLFLPIAEFLTRRAELTSQLDELIEQAILAMLDNRHPIQIRECIKAHLSQPEQQRLDNLLGAQRARTQASTSGPEANVA